MKNIFIYRCRKCGETFIGKDPLRFSGKADPKTIHIDHEAHDTHECPAYKKGTYGIGDLIGAVTEYKKGGTK